MSESDVNIHVLDAAYKPFPTFEEWKARTTLDTARWDRYNIDLKSRAAGLSSELLDRARNVAKRAAAIDTGAIEGLYEVDRGFTYTVAMETATWEAALAQKGEHVRPLFEAQLHAYDYVLDLATKAEPISEAAIRALHEEVCRAQSTYRVITSIGPQEQTLPKGQYKTLPNHVRTRKGTDHSYAPVDVTPAEMARLTAELRGSAFLAAHPVLQAAYAHYSFVVIHPFADGNGRVARALASAFTYRAISMPIVILSEQRDTYLTALENADAGDYQAFVNFILARSLETINLVDESLRCASTVSAEESLAALESLYLTKGGYTHEQVDQAGEKLMQEILQTVQQAIAKVRTPRINSGGGVQSGGATYQIPAGYRIPLSGPRILHVSLSSAPPAVASVSVVYGLLVPKDATGGDDIQIVDQSKAGSQNAFTARVDELTPSLAGPLRIRLNMFAERIANELLVELSKMAQAVMRSRPY